VAVGSPPTVRRRQLGRELRKLREDAHLHLDALAHELRCSPSRISRIETARIRISPGTVHEILDALNIHDQRRDRLVELARQADEPGWWQQFGDALTYEYATYIAMEAEAAALRVFEPSIVHGLLQTQEYAQAMIAKGPAGEGDQKSKIAARLARQEVLSRAAPVRLDVVLDEAAVRRVVGGPGILRRQLERLAHLSHHPNVGLQVLPFAAGATACATGPFTIVDFPDTSENPVVYVENLGGDVYLERPPAVDTFAAVFGQLQADALDHGESRRLVDEIRESLPER